MTAFAVWTRKACKTNLKFILGLQKGTCSLPVNYYIHQSQVSGRQRQLQLLFTNRFVHENNWRSSCLVLQQLTVVSGLYRNNTTRYSNSSSIYTYATIKPSMPIRPKALHFSHEIDNNPPAIILTWLWGVAQTRSLIAVV